MQLDFFDFHIFALTLTDPAPKLMYEMMLSILVTRDFYKSTLNYQINLQYYICVVCDLIWYTVYSICHGFDIDRQWLQLYLSVHSWCLISVLADDDVTVYGWSFLILLKYVFIINEVQCGVINYFSKPYLKLHIASDFWANLVLALRLWPDPLPLQM